MVRMTLGAADSGMRHSPVVSRCFAAVKPVCIPVRISEPRCAFHSADADTRRSCGASPSVPTARVQWVGSPAALGGERARAQREARSPGACGSAAPRVFQEAANHGQRSRATSARSCNAVLVAARDGCVERVIRAHLGRDFNWCCVTAHSLALRSRPIAHVRLVLIDVDDLHPSAGTGLLSWLAQWPEAVFVLLADRGETVHFQQFGQIAALVLLKPLSVKSLRAVARAALR